MRFLFALLSITLLLVGSCTEAVSNDAKKIVQTPQVAVDAHSYAKMDEIKTTHLHLDLDVNFENKTIYGIARHEMKNFGTDTAIFDVKGLEIIKVTLGEKEKELNTDYLLGKEDSILGAPLFVKINKQTKFVNIYYKTTKDSEALDWLAPELTKGKKHPYLYTQGQAILTRTWIPCQDSPSNRITYSADVKVPSDLLALMSAENPTKKSEDGSYHFEMRQAIPAYLIALAVGNLEYRKLGKNCGVYSEPEMIRQVAWEFNDLSKMIKTAESIYGKYQWEQYDVIVLPYSFPFGGMENPRLTFANPTLISGDRSLISVIAHELAHSWSGNLVTNATWNDFWLNEGFTVYFENRIMESLYGKDVADILMLVETQELESEMAEIEHGDHPEDSYLKLSLKGRNPDDGMTTIAYIKGALFLKTLEEKVGREKMDSFMNAYFTDFKFKTVTSEIFENYLTKHLLQPNGITFNTNAWLYEKGLPSNCVEIKSPRYEAMQKMARDFTAGKLNLKKKKWKRSMYITQEWMAFIRQLPSDISVEKLKELDAKIQFKTWGNSEISCEWYQLAIKANYTEIRPEIEKFLLKVGRRKYLLPIYKALANNSDDLAWGRMVYKKARPYYHAVSQGTVDELLK